MGVVVVKKRVLLVDFLGHLLLDKELSFCCKRFPRIPTKLVNVSIPLGGLGHSASTSRHVHRTPYMVLQRLYMGYPSHKSGYKPSCK